MKLKDFYTHIRNACLFHKRINTFCVLTEYNDITKKNLNRNITDKGKPYFMSKSWIDGGYDPNDITYELPGLFVYEMPFDLIDMFSGKEKYEHNIKMLMLLDSRDSLIQSHKSDEDHRLDQEQFDDAKYLLNDVLHYLSHFTKIQSSNLKVNHDLFITRSELAVGIECSINFIEKCPPNSKYWMNPGRYIIDEDGTIIVDNDGSAISYPENN